MYTSFFCSMESDRTATLVFISILVMMVLVWSAVIAAERSTVLFH
jgi:hypothetical protein